MTTQYSTSSIELECQVAFRKAGRAFAYTQGTLSQADAQQMFYEINPVAGWFPLVCLVDSEAVEWLPDPELAELSAEATEAVSERLNLYMRQRLSNQVRAAEAA